MIYKFHFKDFLSVWDLEEEFRKLGIKSYCYAFYTLTEIIKYGKGNDKEWQNGYWGNRAVRQADAFSGWLTYRYTGCNSKTTFLEQLQDKKVHYHKDLVSIMVFDYTQECAALTDDEADDKLLTVEGKLVNDHIEKYGIKPVCNVARTKGEFATNNFNEWFKTV